MNIFFVDRDPVQAAKDLCDKHVVKMTLETAQILCSFFPQGEAPYRRTHVNHPSSVWARQSRQHADWVVQHGLALGEEYTRRYGKTHKSVSVIDWCATHMDLPDLGWVDPPQCMSEEYQCADPVQAYRNYYLNDKRSIAQWKHCEPPKWWRS